MTPVNKPLLQYGWLRALLYFLLSLLLVLVISHLLYTLLYLPGKEDDIPAFSYQFMLISYLAVAVVFVSMAFIFRRYIDRQTIRSMGFKWKGYRGHAAAGFFLGILLLMLGTLILVMLQHLYLTSVVFNARHFLAAVVLFVVVAITEEIAFRGYILNNLMQHMNKWVALFISAILFSVFHGANDNISPIAMLNLFVAGILLGINYIFTRNLWFAVFLHFSWNFFQGPVLGFAVSGLDTPGVIQQTIKGPDLFTGGAFGYEGSLVCLALNILACVFLGAYYAGYRTNHLPEFRH